MAYVIAKDVYNANDIIYLRCEASPYSTSYTHIILADLYGDTKEYGDSEYQEIIQVEYDNIFSYITNSDITYPHIIKIINGEYYIVLPANLCDNGKTYIVQTNFARITDSLFYPEFVSVRFSCFTDPIIQLESYTYSDGNTIEVENTGNTDVAEITITKSFCKLNFSYTQTEGDTLKHYQFFLYDKNGKFLGGSEKIFSAVDMSYSIENYNNLQQYILVLDCVTQHNNSQTLTVYINTDYSQDNIYADISFILDKEKAVNNVIIDIKQLTGTGENYSYDKEKNGDYVIIPDEGYVNFTDVYQVVTNNFLCRLWCKNLSENVPILKITQADGEGYVEVFFFKTKFYAYKYSCGLKTRYVSNELDEEISEDTNIYFSIGYYNGRIEMYTAIV